MMVVVVAMIMPPVASITHIDAVMYPGWIAVRGTSDQTDRHQARNVNYDQGYGTPHDKFPAVLITIVAG
jgi:hypothetical protein